MMRSVVLGMMLGSVSLPASVMAQEPPMASVENPVIKPPAWLVRPAPTPDQYPKFASIIGLHARIKVACDVTAQGRPMNCAVEEAMPSGAGFEDLAIEVVEAGRLSPAETAQGPTESRIALSINFSLQPQTPDPLWAGGPEPTAAQIEGGWVVVRRFRQLGFTQARMVDEGFGLVELTPHRRQVIRPWVIELFPADYTDEGRARSMSRVLAQRGLDRLPDAQPDDWATAWVPQLRAAAAIGFDREAALAELKRRYCEAFECAPDSPAP